MLPRMEVAWIIMRIVEVFYLMITVKRKMTELCYPMKMKSTIKRRNMMELYQI
jgi:membrane carboxypeptidase/penicillin-binding protein